MNIADINIGGNALAVNTVKFHNANIFLHRNNVVIKPPL